MKIHAVMSDRGACGHFRIKWPAEALQRAGFDVELHEPGPMDYIPVQIGLQPGTGRPVARLIAEPDFDVLVVQRPTSWRAAAAFECLERAGVRVVVDLDDDLTVLHARHAMWHVVHPSYNQESNFQHLKRACRSATRVIGATPALANRFGGGNRGVVAYNCVPDFWLEGKRERTGDRILVGWTGRVGTHPDSLTEPGIGVRKALEATGAEFAVIGSADGVAAQLGLTKVLEYPGRNITEYPDAVAELDVGIAPLANTAFNRAKSWLKPLDYASVGVPFVMSSTPEYDRICAQGAGVIATKPREWEQLLKKLIAGGPQVEDMVAQGRAVAAKWTFDNQIDMWARAWTGGVQP